MQGRQEKQRKTGIKTNNDNYQQNSENNNNEEFQYKVTQKRYNMKHLNEKHKTLGKWQTEL